MGLGNALARWFSGAPVYVRLRRDLLSLRDAGTGRVVEEAPWVALTGTKPRTILAIGRNAAQEAALKRVPYELVNGFGHPRVVIGDFQVAERTLAHLLRQLLQPTLLRASPVMVLHPLDDYAGGLSQIEVRALKELAAGAGAREAFVWGGRELTDGELRDGLFREGEGCLRDDSLLGGR